jgi:hypothetical protein
MVGRRSMADIQVAAKEACANKDSSPMAKADASARVADPARRDHRKRPRPNCLRKGSGFFLGSRSFVARTQPDIRKVQEQTRPQHPQSRGPKPRSPAVIDEKMFAFKDELSSNSR